MNKWSPLNGFWRSSWVRAGLLLVLALVALWGWTRFRAEDDAVVQARLVALPGVSQDFPRVEGPPSFSFPRDHGAHPEYQTEWWYYTGNLQTSTGRHFGYQLTFFRRAILPEGGQPVRSSQWATDQIYLAHFAITDVQGKRFQSFERVEREAVGLAGASVNPTFQVWLADWRVKQVGVNEYRLTASEGDLALDLILVDRKGPVLQGDTGYSQKGEEPGNASVYVSQTRLETQGTVAVGTETLKVNGLSWMDHEYSTSALSPGLVGWDWFALQLDDGSELMLYNLRQEDGSQGTFSSGAWIAPDGSYQRLSRAEFQIRPVSTWRSPHSGAEYPSGWEIVVPGLEIDLVVEPLLLDQEHQLFFSYWEGAVRVSGTRAGERVQGSGYVELTGYAGSMQGQL